jgi:hypothetical protein
METDRLKTQLQETGEVSIPPVIGVTYRELRNIVEGLGLDERFVWIRGGRLVHTDEGRD